MAGIYQDGLDRRTANFQPLSPLWFLTRAVRLAPDRAAVIHGELCYSYRDFYGRCVRLASALRVLGVGAGDTVAVLSPNAPPMLEAHYAAAMLGAVINPLNIRLEPAGIGFILEHGEAKVFIVDSELAPTARAALDGTAARPTLIDIVDPLAPGERLGGYDYDALLADGSEDLDWPGPADEWDAISLNYTSGTTGDPKGVVYHHRGAYLTGMANIVAFRLSSFPVFLWTLPMFHCNGWGNIWSVVAQAGTQVCLRQVDPAAVFSLIAEHRVTHCCGAPVVLNMLVNAPEDVRRDFAQPVEYTVGGAAPPAALMQRAEALGFIVTHGYGLTECYGPGAFCTFHPEWEDLPLEERAAQMQRQGIQVLSQTDMQVMEQDTLQPVPWDGETIGEIMLRGNGIMKGYVKNPAATERAFEGGWFRSGDLAVVHPEGYVEVRDRAKDIIISGGENISSLEVENRLYRHPAVLEAAVVAQPHPHWGEVPCAFVTLKPGEAGKGATAQALIDYCRQHLAHFKAPKSVVFGELPKTATGKVQKHVLRDRAAEAAARDAQKAG